MKILVTGGAGYIGSVTVHYLQKQGHEVVVLDNLSTGHKESVEAELVVGDLLDKEQLFQNLGERNFDGVIHFAAAALAGESMKNPYYYFRNNINGGLNLLELMRKIGTTNIIFSSTCAIYGTPQKLPVSESESKKPDSVYGESKLMFERILDWYDKIYGIKYINLRYFNACGASIDGKLGENHNPETHIIPIAIKASMTGASFPLFGDDYETKDGTCVRDYIHVEDLAIAHLQALNILNETRISDSFNVGTGNGYSNLEVIKSVENITGKAFKIEKKPRRSGDSAIIFADNSKAVEKLGFNPKYSDIDTIIESAWKWHSKQF